MLNDVARATPEECDMSSTVLAEIEPAVERMIARDRIPGAAVVISRGSKLVYAESFGHARLAERQPFGTDTVVRIYSMTKTITSAAALQAIADNAIALDEPIANWIPELADLRVFHAAAPPSDWPSAEPITVRHLLAHTSGLTYGQFDDPRLTAQYAEAKLLARESTLTEMARRLGELPLVFQPGTRWQYSIATDVLGLLVERIIDRPLADWLATRFFAPLQMCDTGFHVRPESRERFADLYQYNQQRQLQLHRDAKSCHFLERPTLCSGGAGLVSTAEDFIRFAMMLGSGGIWNGRRVLGAEAVQRLVSNQLPEALLPIDLGGPRTGVGFGFGGSVVVGRLPLAPFVPLGEFGWSGNGSTHFWISPSDELAVVAVTQKLPFTFDLENRVKRIVYRAIK